MYRLIAVRLVLLVSLLALVVAACGDGEQADAAEGDGDGGVVEEEADVVAAGDNVGVYYTGTLDNGEVFDSNVGGETLDFTAGAGQMIAGFDAAVIGMAVGDTKIVRIEPADAYGEYQEGLVIEIERTPELESVVAGDQLSDGVGNRVTVVEVRDTVLVIDRNHPLAGEALTFEIELAEIR